MAPAPLRVGERAVARVVRTGSRLLRQGELQPHFVFIKNGLVMLKQLGLDGVERPVALVGRGTLLGMYGFHRLPAELSAEAVGSVALCQIPFRPLQAALSDAGLGAQALLAQNRKSLAMLLCWSQLTRMPALSDRLASALWLLAHALQARNFRLPSQGVLAELLCVTRESVNRALRKFEQQGVFRRCAGSGVELDMERLATLLNRPAAVSERRL